MNILDFPADLMMFTEHNLTNTHATLGKDSMLPLAQNNIDILVDWVRHENFVNWLAFDGHVEGATPREISTIAPENQWIQRHIIKKAGR